MTDPRRSLARCVGEVDRFLSHAWDQRVHLHRGENYADLLSLEDVDHIVATMGLRAPAFRLVNAGATVPQSAYTRKARVGSRDITDLIDVARVHALFSDGATIVLQGLHRYWAPVAQLVRDLELVLTHPVQANAYVTPPVSQGLKVHDDPHDVFALQAHGRKQWVTYDDPDTEPTLDVELVPGDALYVPRGTPHAARTVDEPSIHLTIGVKVLTWADVARSALRGLDVGLGDALPAGFANDPEAFTQVVASRVKAVAHELGAVDSAAVAADVARGFWATRPPLLDGQLAQLLAVDGVTDTTVVSLRRGAVCRLENLDDPARIRLELGDRQVLLPAAAEPAVRCILERGQLRVADLEPFLDDQGRLVLVRRLVREGLLVASLG